MVKARFEIFRDSAGEYRFRLIAPNNKIIAVSEGYKNKSGCLHGIEAIKRYASEAEIIEEES